MEAEELYQSIILDHFRNPRNQREILDEELMVEEYNPICGDKVRMRLSVRDNKLTSLAYDVKGCAISMASTSILSETVQGRMVPEVFEIISFIQNMFCEKSIIFPEKWGEIRALESVKRFPMRIKCALLGWDALVKCLDKKLNLLK